MLKHAQVVPIVDSMSTVDDQGIPVVELTNVTININSEVEDDTNPYQDRQPEKHEAEAIRSIFNSTKIAPEVAAPVSNKKKKRRTLSRRDSFYGRQTDITAAMQQLLSPEESFEIRPDKFSYNFFLEPRIYYWLIIAGILPTQKCPLALKIWWTCAGVLMFLVSIFYVIPLAEMLACGADNSCVVNKQQGPTFGMTLSSPVLGFAWLVYPVNLWIASRIMQGTKMKLLLLMAAGDRVRSSTYTSFAFAINIVAVTFPVCLLVITVMIHDDRSIIQSSWIVVGITSCVCLPALLGITATVAVIADAMQSTCDDLVMDLAQTKRRYTGCVPGKEETRLRLRYHQIITLSTDVTRRLSPVFFVGIPCMLIGAVTLSYTSMHSDSDNTPHIFVRYCAQFQIFMVLAGALPVLFAMGATESVTILERAVNLVPFENQELADFIERTPLGWRIGISRCATKLSKRWALAMLGLGTFFSLGFDGLVTFQQDRMSPVWYTGGYTEHEGSCHDGFWNGREEFVDCGGLCNRSCAGVHGDYILLPQYGIRYNSDGVARFIGHPINCEDIDGYIDIPTQKECEVAHWVWSAPKRKSSHIARPAQASMIMSDTMPAGTDATDAPLFACGAHLKRPGVNTRATLSFFPALFPKLGTKPLDRYNLGGYHYFVGEWPNRAMAYLCMTKDKLRSLQDRESVRPAQRRNTTTAAFRLIPQEWSTLIAPYTSMMEEYLTTAKPDASDRCNFVSNDCVSVSAATAMSPPPQGFACRWVVGGRGVRNGAATLSIKFEWLSTDLPHTFPPLLHVTDPGRHTHQIVGYDERTVETRVSDVSPGSFVDYFIDARATNAPHVTICVERY